MTGKLNKTQIDELRDSALSMKVGGVGDGEITEMVSVADKDLYFVNERALFRLFLADEVDPLRQNANIPNSNQRILSAGSSSEVVGRSFLTANACSM